MNYTLLIIIMAFAALFMSTTIILFMLQMMWAVAIFFALGAGVLVLRSRGITWGRLSYRVRLFIYRHL